MSLTTTLVHITNNPNYQALEYDNTPHELLKPYFHENYSYEEPQLVTINNAYLAKREADLPADVQGTGAIPTDERDTRTIIEWLTGYEKNLDGSTPEQRRELSERHRIRINGDGLVQQVQFKAQEHKFFNGRFCYYGEDAPERYAEDLRAVIGTDKTEWTGAAPLSVFVEHLRSQNLDVWANFSFLSAEGLFTESIKYGDVLAYAEDFAKFSPEALVFMDLLELR